MPTEEAALDGGIGNKDGHITLRSGKRVCLSVMLKHTQNFHDPCNHGGGHHGEPSAHNVPGKILVHQHTVASLTFNRTEKHSLALDLMFPVDVMAWPTLQLYISLYKLTDHAWPKL